MNEFFIDMLYIEYTKRCNSKCITCDYWKNSSKEEELDLYIIDSVDKLYKNGLKVLLFTGGEALLKGDNLFELANKLKLLFPKLELRLLTNGILVGKYIEQIVKVFDSVVFSFDTINNEKYLKIRGLDSYELVVNNIKLVRKQSSKIEIRLRTMILKENIEELSEIVKLAIELNVNKISFLLVDTESDQGFGRNFESIDGKNTLKNKIDSDALKNQIVKIEELKSKENEIFINSIINNLKELMQFLLKGSSVHKSCNAPLNSIVIDSLGNVLPCFFKKTVGNIKTTDILEILNSNEYRKIHKERNFRNCKECKKCIL